MDQPIIADRFDWHGCNVVRYDKEKLGGRATVREWRMDADGVLINFERGMSVEEIEEQFGVDRDAIQSILEFAQQKGFMATKGIQVPA